MYFNDHDNIAYSRLVHGCVLYHSISPEEVDYKFAFEFELE